MKRKILGFPSASKITASAFWGLAAGLMLAGCSALPLEGSGVPHPTSRVPLPMASERNEYVGVIHLHTTASDGQKPLESIVPVAARQGLDFLVVTDHNVFAPEDRREQWFGNLLVLLETEISTQAGHYLSLGTAEAVPAGLTPRQTVRAVADAGGLGFIAHPFDPRRPWPRAEVQGATGLEIYNAKPDVRDENKLWMGAWILLTGSDFSLTHFLDRPADALALWDSKRVGGEHWVGIGAPDAHGLRVMGLRLGPYSTLFKFVRNHLLIPGPLTRQGLYEALRAGHLFVAHDVIADARGFRFALVGADGSVRGIMGDRLSLRPGDRLMVYLPAPGRIDLYRDGMLLSQAAGQVGWFVVEQPGVYRAEGRRKGKPWVYSNPIVILPPASDQRSA